MKHNNKYIYPKTVRETIEGKRHYDIDSKEKLPSVTTILSNTQDPGEGTIIKSVARSCWRGQRDADRG